MTADSIAPWAEPVLFTADALATLPDDAWHYELVQGRLVRMSPSGLRHGDITRRILGILGGFVDEHSLGLVVAAETGFHISRPGEPDTVLAPDAAFIARERVPSENSHDWIGFPRLAPDLVVEIASPGQHGPEMAAKAQVWLDSGVRVVWIFWPTQRQVDVWDEHDRQAPRTLHAGDELDGADVLPGFRLQLDRLW